MENARKPVPVPSLESKAYWEGLRGRRLLMPRCDACGKFWFPPSVLCPHCGSDQSRWQELSGRGKVFSYVVFHRVYHPAFADDVPYVVAVIALDEGPRMISNVIGIPPDQVRCDMPVEIVFADGPDGTVLPKFRPI